MAGKLVTGLVAGGGAFIGLVVGSAIATLVSKKVDTYETKTATLVLGGMTGMVLGAGTAAAIAAEPEPEGGTAGTAGLPAGVGSDLPVPDPLHPECTITLHCTRDAQGREHCTSTSSCANVQTLQGLPRGAGAINSQLEPRRA